MGLLCACSITDQYPLCEIQRRHGVEITTDVVAVPTDSAVKSPLSYTIKVMTIENEDEERKKTKLIRKILRDCNRILNQKAFTVISIDQNDEFCNKMYKYQNGNVIEICELEQEEDRLTSTVTQVIGLPAGMERYKNERAPART